MSTVCISYDLQTEAKHAKCQLPVTMKEDSKPINIACSAFVPQRFRAGHCGRCFRSRAQHKQFMREHKINQTQLIENRSNHGSNLSASDEETPQDTEGDITTDYYTAEEVKLCDTEDWNQRQILKKSIARRNREVCGRRQHQENGFKLNITAAETNDLSICSDQNKDMNGSGSENDSVTDINSNPKLFNNLPNGTDSEDLSDVNEFNIDTSVQYLKAFQVARKSSIPILKMSKEPVPESKRLQEFQEVAKNLRHVSSGHYENGDQLWLSAKDVEEQQRVVEAESPEKLANAAFQTACGNKKHGTSLKNVGTAVPRPYPTCMRQLSDPAPLSSRREERKVVEIPTTESAKECHLSSKTQVVTSSQITSEIHFVSNSSKTQSKKNSTEQPNSKNSIFESYLDHTEKPVTIVAADGSISHYRGTSDTSEVILPKLVQSRRRFSQPKHQAMPYKVVDIARKPPQASPTTFSEPMSPPIPLSPPPAYKTSSVVESEQDSFTKVTYRLKDSLAKFPKRNVALVDGIYSSMQIGQQDNSDYSLLSRRDSDILKSPPTEDVAPPFPILLSESESDQSDNRRNSTSSNYKVAIFISPKNYDNLGTALSDKEFSSVSDLSRDPASDYGYLIPMHSKKFRQDTEEPTTPTTPKSSDIPTFASGMSANTAEPTSPSNSMRQARKSRWEGKSEPNSNNSQSSSDSHWRAKTHPTSMDPIYAKIDKKKSTITRSNTDIGRSRQKRPAPLPPNRDTPDGGKGLPNSASPGLPLPLHSREQKPSGITDDNQFTPSNKVITSPSPQTPNQLSVIYEAFGQDQSSVNEKSTIDQDDLPVAASHGSIHNPIGKGSALPTKVQPNQERVNIQDLQQTALQNGGDAMPLCTPPRPMSPRLSPSLLPDSSPYQTNPNSKDNKQKRLKLPWRRRRKRNDESGSPERGFDSTEVERWLETVHRLKKEDDAQRNSMDRLAVINAYRGEQTAFIDHAELVSSSPGTSPDQNEEDSDSSGIKLRLGSSSGKRRAPKPPAAPPGRPTSWMAGTHPTSPSSSLEDVQHLKKCYSLSPQSKRRASHGDGFRQYENAGVLREIQMKIAPPKPERRRRNMTTGFENLPSHREASLSEGANRPALQRQTSSDPDLSTLATEPSPPSITSSGIPLKSALKVSGSFESKKAEIDPKAQPRRPVRIIAPPGKPSTAPTSVNIYSNVEIVQRGLGASNSKTSIAAVVFRADAETQCTPSSEMASNTSPSDLADGVGAVVDMNRTCLQRLAATAVIHHDRLDFKTKSWQCLLRDTDQPTCTVSGAVFYKSSCSDTHTSLLDVAVMFGQDSSQASDLVRAAQCSQTIAAHPNIVNVLYASIESIPSRMIVSNQAEKDVSEEKIAAATVVMDRLPRTDGSSYIADNKELHAIQPETYEHDVCILLLQLLTGLHHLQMHHVCLTGGLQPEHLLLVRSKHPGGGSVLVINHLMAHIQPDPTAATTSNCTPGDIYGSAGQQEEKQAEFIAGLLVYQFLHLPRPFSVGEMSTITQDYDSDYLTLFPMRSKYSQGLCKIASGLLVKDPSDQLSASQAIARLQCLLWGPEAGTEERMLQRWLVEEQAKKVTSMCEYCIPAGSGDKQTGFSLTDQLQCQFLSDTSAMNLYESIKFLYQ